MANATKQFLNLALNGAAGGQNLGVGTYSTNGVPIKGAKAVVFTIKATNSQALTSATINVGPNADRALGPYLSPGSLGYTQRGNQTARADQGGVMVVLLPNDVNGRCYYPFAQCVLVVPATMNAVTVDAEVFYDGDAESFAGAMGQHPYTPLTT